MTYLKFKFPIFLLLSTLFFSNLFSQHFTVELEDTGESTLFIFQDSILGLENGDEIGVFDSEGVTDNLGNVGPLLVGAGVWTGEQLEIVAVGAVDLSQFGGPILPGAVSGNQMSLKVWKSNEDVEYDATYSISSGTGTFNGLFSAISAIDLVPLDPPYFNLEIDDTGESSLFIFQDTIEGLSPGDELGIFDSNGVLDSNGNTGEILVGAGIWEGGQLEITAITAVDLSQFGGPILPGANDGNPMMLKVWNDIEEMEYSVTYNVVQGSGTFDGLFTAINGIAFAPTYTIAINEFFFRANEEVPDYVELFNYGTEDLDLTGWSLTDGEDAFDGSFDGYDLPAGGYLLLAGEDPFFNEDGDEFYAGEDIDNSLFFDISLSTSSDVIMLLDSDGNEVDMVVYDNDFGWPSGNSFRGQAAELSDPMSDNNDPINWSASNAEGTYMFTEDGDAGEDFGTPGEENSNYGGAPIYGCTDQAACNFNSEATADDGSCEFAQDNFDCDGNCLVNVDCNGVCGGTSELDECGVCDGSGPEENFDCDGNCLVNVDCNGVCGGTSELDECGVCDGDGLNPDGCCGDETVDCNGQCGGSSVNDDCGVCDGDNSTCSGCTDSEALNFDDSALIDDGSCLIAGPNYPVDWDSDFDGFFDNIYDYQNNGSITSRVYLDDVEIGDSGDLMAAFVNGEQRGFVSALDIPPFLGGGYGFLILIYSNEVQGESVTFQYYDFDEDTVYELGETVEFESDMVIGSLNDPFMFNVSTGIDIDVSLVPGWNWFSSNVYIDDMNLNSFFDSLEDGSALYIKSQDAYSDYYEGYGWFGPLSEIDNKYMYKLNMNTSDNIVLTGTPVDVDNTVIPLSVGWNWIGYTPQNSLDINDALSGLQPDHGLYIKSQDAYSDYYSGYGWFGPLSTLSPFQGYLLNMVLADELVYTSGLTMSYQYEREESIWDLNIHEFEFNGSATIEVLIDGNQIVSDNYELAAFDGDKCVGIASPLKFPMTDAYVFPMMMYNNNSTSNIEFKLYDKENDKFMTINNSVDFYEDMHLGNGYEPVVMNTNDIVPTEIIVSSPYPNPFNPVMNLDVELYSQGYIKASVYNLNGQLVDVIHDGQMGQGKNSLTWNAQSNPSGIYFINVEGVNGSLANYKISLLK